MRPNRKGARVIIYVWKCPEEHVTEVTRRVADMDTPPDDGCETCKSRELTRIIVRPKGVQGYILEGTGWAFDGYVRSMHRKKHED